jgi:acid stress-induced BolA-like protein IbaG/YrbA
MANHVRVAGGPASASDVIEAIRTAIESAIAESRAEVSGGGGHYNISVVSPAFAGKSRLECQRMVLRSVKSLMEGEGAPLHAVDSLLTRVP